MDINLNAKNVHRLCPICSYGVGAVLHNQRFFLPEEQHFLPDAYDIVACLKCGFVYADTSASQEDYDRYYQKFSKYEDKAVASGSGTTPWDAQRLEETANDIARFLPDISAAILDIGCANGGLLAALKNKNYHNLTGLDPSSACVSYIYKEYGIRAIVGGLFTLNLNSTDSSSLREKFDCVILSHVLEHIRDLQTTIKKLFFLIKIGGLLYIEVPDASRYSDYYIVPYYYFDQEHINHFDEHSLENLILQNGFERVFHNKKEIPFSEKKLYPVVYGFYRKVRSDICTQAIIPGFKARDNVSRYIERSRQADRRSELDELALSQEEIVVWGAGSFTFRLLESSPLGKCNITAFIDKDKKKQGLKLKNATIYPPTILKKHKCPVIVSSALFSDEIIKEIKGMGISNKIIVMK